ncbi:MAG: hypothetical protein JO327_01750 [Nitrososphaeraceae archaeon]|nr:hypothetical protein [Nitrososphaeraceae archaeon]
MSFKLLSIDVNLINSYTTISNSQYGKVAKYLMWSFSGSKSRNSMQRLLYSETKTIHCLRLHFLDTTRKCAANQSVDPFKVLDAGSAEQPIPKRYAI